MLLRAVHIRGRRPSRCRGGLRNNIRVQRHGALRD